jgi:curved DNA-binding protein CbpA
MLVMVRVLKGCLALIKMAFKNYYIILGIKNTASLDEIKSAFRKLAKKYHPDKNRDNAFHDDFFKEIQEAYEVLSHYEKRKKYDQTFAYANSYERIRTKTYAPYAGNAYQYAQQQAQYERRYQQQTPENATGPVKEKKSGTDPYLFIISMVVAILLLLFIILYSR